MAAGPELEEGEIGEVIKDVSAAAAPIEAPAVRRSPRYGMPKSQHLTRLLQLEHLGLLQCSHAVLFA